MDSELQCSLEEYFPKYTFKLLNSGLSMLEAERIFQLTPEPPRIEKLNDHIVNAVTEKDYKHFFFFLHHYERRLNRTIQKFRTLANDLCYAPERFLDMKLASVEMMFEKLAQYDPTKGATFLTFVHHDLRNAMLEICRLDESWSFKKLNTYKGIRSAAFLSNNYSNARGEFAKRHRCSLEKADQYIREARCLHSREPLYYENDSSGENEIRWPGRYWDFAKIITDVELHMALREAFEQLSPRDRYFLEKRNGICMACGHVKTKRECLTFDKLGARYNITTEDGAEKAYKKAVEHLAIQMMENGHLRTVKLKLKSITKRKKKIAAAVYEYQADCDGDWGDIYFDFEKGSHYIQRLADWDTTNSKIYANKVISFVLQQDSGNLPKEKFIVFE